MRKRITIYATTFRMLLAKSVVVLSVISTIGGCFWAITSRVPENREEQQYDVTLLSGDNNLVQYDKRLDLERSEQEAVSLIHSILGEYYTGLREEEEKKLAGFIYHEGNQQGLDPFLLVAMIRAESTFHNFSESDVGAKGLMQILPSVGRSIAKEANIQWEGENTLFNPNKNIRIGASYMKMLLRQFNDLHLALVAYNLGPTTLRNHLRSGKRVSSFFAEKVISYYQDLQKKTREETG